MFKIFKRNKKKTKITVKTADEIDVIISLKKIYVSYDMLVIKSLFWIIMMLCLGVFWRIKELIEFPFLVGVLFVIITVCGIVFAFVIFHYIIIVDNIKRLSYRKIKFLRKIEKTKKRLER